jgi:metacaspase-1
MAKKAVLIGINRYRIPGSDLRGCINDVRNMQAVLTQYYGFGAGDVTVLTDGAATKKAMQKAIADLVTRAKKGDVVLVHYSGHGSNVPDDNGDEADKRDEILCPTDLDWNDPLSDDWLRKTFNRLKAGVNLTVVFDCCHSGTATRAIMPPDAPSIPRYLPCPLDLMATESGRKLRGRVTRGMRASKPAARKKGDVAIADIGEVLITGCRATQTSADAHIGGAYNGALTYHLVAAIKAHDGHLTNRELHTATRAALAKANFDQVPQLEGQKEHLDRPFLAPLD